MSDQAKPELPLDAMIERYLDLLATRYPIVPLVWGKPNPGERTVYWLELPERLRG